MKIGKLILLLLLCMYMLSCNFSSKEPSSTKVLEDEDPPIYYETNQIKNFFIPYGDDSLLMIPDFILVAVYELHDSTAREQYKSYQEFKREFLYNPKNLSKLSLYSDHIRINKEIMHDYHHMGFDDFWNKYLYVEGEDTLSSINDTTLAYCLDKHDFYSIFNYCKMAKFRVVKSEYPYEYSRIIEKQQERLNKYIKESSKLGNR